MFQTNKTNSCYNFVIISTHAMPLTIKPPTGEKDLDNQTGLCVGSHK